MEILKIHEAKEGENFVEMECRFTEYEVNFFLNYAVNDILKKQIERMKNEHGSDGNDREVHPNETSEPTDI